MTFDRRTMGLLLAALLLPGQALAHAMQTLTAPEDGAVVQGSPRVIAVGFDMPMRITSIMLRNDRGERFDLERTDRMQPVTHFEARPAPLSAGRYVVEWRGLAGDGHAMSGSFGFTVE